jgi:two-component system sensor histidine kinase AgrC
MDNSLTYYTVASVIEAFILWLYCNKLFKQRLNTPLSILIAIIMHLLSAPVYMLHFPVLNIISFILITYIVTIIISDISFFSAIFHSLMLTVVMGLSELLVVGFVPNLYILFFRESSTINNNTLLYVFLSKTIYLFISQAVSTILIKRKGSYPYSDRSTFFLSIIPAISIIIMLCMSFICISIPLTSKVNAYISVSILLLLAINMFTFYMQQIIVRKNNENARLLLELQHESDNVQYYNSLKDNYDKQRILIHDIKEHLNTIALLNDGKHTTEISEYISELSDSDALKASRTYCKNPIFNAILSRYAQICESEVISFAADIRYRTLDYFSANDYASLFGNMLDNAVAAAKGNPDAYIDCNVSLIQNGNADLICVINSCAANPIALDGSLNTTKSDTVNHGLGTRSIKRIADKYDGLTNYIYDEEKHCFKYVIVIQHPDIMQ